MLAEHIGHRAIGKRFGKSHALRHVGDDAPVRPRLARQRQELALPRDAPLRIGDGAVLLAPGRSRQQHMRAGVDGVVAEHVVGDDEQLQLFQRRAHRGGARQRGRRIGRHHPQRLDLPALDRLEHLHGLEALALSHVRRVPEPAHAVDLDRHEIHVRGKLIGETAHLASAHRVGLAGQRQRPHAGLADPAGRKMDVDDGVDLVGALRRLVHALRITRDAARLRSEQIEELRDVGLGEAGRGGGRRDVRRDLPRTCEGLGKARGVRFDIRVIEPAGIGQMHQQAAEQRRVGAGRDGKKEIGVVSPSRCGEDR